MDEGVGATVPEGAAKRHGSGRVPFHVVELAMLDDCREAHLVNLDVEKLGDAFDAAGKIALQIGEMQQHDVGQASHCPPTPHILEERPERVTIALEPIAVILHDI